MAENSGKNLAQAQFAKLQRANDAKQAMADYESEAVAMRAKTERLRALRLARDAELAAAEAAAPPAAKKPKAVAKPKAAGKPKAAKGTKDAKGTKSTLGDWIDARESGGHNN